MGCVYLIGSREHGWYKIGYSIHEVPHKRVKAIADLLPFSVELLDFRKVSNYSLVENLIHRHFQSRHVRGEWFRLTDSDLTEFNNLAADYDFMTKPQRRSKRKTSHEKLRLDREYRVSRHKNDHQKL
jgi:hypothetical protein